MWPELVRTPWMANTLVKYCGAIHGYWQISTSHKVMVAHTKHSHEGKMRCKCRRQRAVLNKPVRGLRATWDAVKPESILTQHRETTCTGKSRAKRNEGEDEQQLEEEDLWICEDLWRRFVQMCGFVFEFQFEYRYCIQEEEEEEEEEESTAQIHRSQEQEKRRQYEERIYILNVERGTFTPLVFSATGGAGPAATAFFWNGWPTSMRHKSHHHTHTRWTG